MTITKKTLLCPEEQFKRFMVEYSLLYRKENVKVGVLYSGGVDSSVLFHVVNKYKEAFGLNITLLHLILNDFSGYEEAHSNAISLAKENNLKLVTKFCNLKETSGSINLFVREHKKELAFEGDFDLVVTAHHLNDQIETILFRLFRAAGIDGLKGMTSLCEFSNERKTVVFGKPFLRLSKDTLINYARNNSINFVDDETNFIPDFSDRNFIRNKIIPLIEERFMVENIAKSAENIQEYLEQEELYKETISQGSTDIYSGAWSVNFMINLPIKNRVFVVREYLRKILGYNINKAVIKNLEKSFKGDLTTFRVDLGRGFIVRTKGEEIVVEQIKSEEC